MFHLLSVFALLFCLLFSAKAEAQLLTGYSKDTGTLEQTQEITRELLLPVSDLQTAPSSVPSLTGHTTSAVTPSLRTAQALKSPVPQTQKDRSPKEKGEKTPVDLTADHLEHDEVTQTITASGNVELVQAGRILRADQVRYELNTDRVMAKGNIILTEPNGDVHFAEEVKLSREMQEGFVTGLQTYLAEGGRFIASEGHKQGEKVYMKNASYTPCECDEDEDGNPAWQIKAKEIIYHEDENRVSYKNARFELFGVPVAYTPYLSHPDGKVKRKSGLLPPTFGFDSQLGAVMTSKYYWDIAPHKDATTGVMLSTSEAPVAIAEYRHRFNKAELELNGSVTRSERTDSVAGVDVEQDDDFRGHFFADGLWDIDNKWRAGLGLELTSDDQYLRQYDFSSKDVLENEVYVERFSGRHYSAGRLLAFQDLRIGEARTDQPNVVPEVETHVIAEPGTFLGGRLSASASVLGLQRDGDGQDVNRAVLEGGWQRRHVMNSGLVNTLDTSLRGDLYRVHDKQSAVVGSGRNSSGSETRLFPQVHLLTSYPLAKQFEKTQAVIEPVVALTLAPNINVVDTDIPNEDSQDVQIDASNLFEPNRFPGKDRIEDRSRVTYGVRTGLYGYQGSHADVFIGQSHRFDDKDNPFPDGSGLSRQDSDVVGQMSALYDNRYGMNYRLQLDSQNLSSNRHEFDGYANWDRFQLGSRYLFAKALEGTDISESREQVESNVLYDLTESWRLSGGALYDLGEDQGLRQAIFGFDYSGCCLSFSVRAERNLTTEASGDSSTDIMFRVGLKGLGEFDGAGLGN